LFRNLPNLFTVLRLAAVPFLIASLGARRYRLALALIFAAGFTDALDGFLARRFGWVTRFGAYLDPIADKAMLVSVYVMLAYIGIAPIWLLTLILGRDLLILLMVAYAFLATSIRSFPPSAWGKISTAIQMLTALVILLNQAFGFPGPVVASILIVVTAAATVWSGLHYAWLGIRTLRARPT